MSELLPASAQQPAPALSPGLPARSLPELLRRQLEAAAGGACSLAVGTVKANPDSKHVTVTLNGVDSTVAKLTGYAPVVGEPCYLLIAEGITLAIGSVR